MSLKRAAKVTAWAAAIAILLGTPLIGAHSDYGCDGCHTPHNAGTLPGVPLWNGAETTKSFAGLMYSSATMDADDMAVEPDGASKLCLSCHDGSNSHTHLEAHQEIDWSTGEPITDEQGNPILFAPTAWEDLRGTHPISFTYDDDLAAADDGLKSPSEPSGLGGTIAEDMLDPLGKVQCTSCHDVHTTGIGENLLRGKDYFHGPGGGDLCRICHKK